MNTVLSIKGPIEKDVDVYFHFELSSPNFGNRILGSSVFIPILWYEERLPWTISHSLKSLHIPQKEIERIVPEFLKQSTTGPITFKSIINNYEWKP